MKTNHTPGPWRSDGTENISEFTDGDFCPHAVIRSPSERWVALVEQGDSENQANAKLIAAAPEMLEALENLLRKTERLAFQHNTIVCAQDMARAAIAKATE